MVKRKFGEINREDFHVPNGQKNMAVVEAVAPDSERTHLDVEFTALLPNPRQPRTVFDETKLQELADSIEENGLIEEIVIRRSIAHKGYFEIICGERRVRACRDKLHRSTIAATLMESVDDRQLLQIALIENDQREQVSPYDLALGYKELYESTDDVGQRVYTIRSLAKALGKDKSVVQELIDLTKAAPEALQLIQEDPSIPVRIVNEISHIPEPADRVYMVSEVRAKRLKTDDVIAIVKTLKNNPAVPQPEAETKPLSEHGQRTGEGNAPPSPASSQNGTGTSIEVTTVEEHERVVRPSEQLIYAETLRSLAKHSQHIEKIVRVYAVERKPMSGKERAAVNENVSKWMRDLQQLLS